MTDSDTYSTYAAEVGPLTFRFTVKWHGRIETTITNRETGLVVELSEHDWEKVMVSWREADSDCDDVNS